jgi:hypothetical protein
MTAVRRAPSTGAAFRRCERTSASPSLIAHATSTPFDVAKAEALKRAPFAGALNDGLGAIRFDYTV